MDAHPGFFIKELERLLTKVTPYRAPPKKWVQMLAAWTTRRTCAKGVVLTLTFSRADEASLCLALGMFKRSNCPANFLACKATLLFVPMIMAKRYTFWGGAPRGVVPICSLQSTLRSQRVNTERIKH